MSDRLSEIKARRDNLRHVSKGDDDRMLVRRYVDDVTWLLTALKDARRVVEEHKQASGTVHSRILQCGFGIVGEDIFEALVADHRRLQAEVERLRERLADGQLECENPRCPSHRSDEGWVQSPTKQENRLHCLNCDRFFFKRGTVRGHVALAEGPDAG